MSEQQLIREDIEAYLARHEQKTLLRFVIVGSVAVLSAEASLRDLPGCIGLVVGPIPSPAG